MFISGNRLLYVTVGWRYQRMRVLHRSSGFSTDRAHNVVLLKKNEVDIRNWSWRQRHHAQSTGVWRCG